MTRNGLAVRQPRTPMQLSSTDATRALLRGSTLLTSLLGRTLGPHAATVFALPPEGHGRPEALSRAGTVARRIVEISDPFENMGMLLARHAACTTDTEVGDGVATTAVMLEHLLTTATRLVASGYSPQLLTREIDAAHECLIASLQAARLSIDAAEATAAVVAQAIPEPELAAAIVDAIDGVGPNGWVQTRPSYGALPDLEFVEGMRVASELSAASAAAGNPMALRAIGPCRVAVCGEPLADLSELAGLVDRVARTGAGNLLVFAPSMAQPVSSAVATMAPAAPAMRLLAVSLGPTGDETLHDIAAYANTRVLSSTAGDRLSTVDPSILGVARRAWATADECGIVASSAHPATRERMTAIKRQIGFTHDTEAQATLRQRMAMLSGSVARLAVPGFTEVEVDERRARVEAALRAAQHTTISGVLAGGGAALAVADVGPATVGALALRDAAAEPLRRIAARAGLNPGSLLEQTRAAAPGSRFDVVRETWRDGASPEVVDPLAVVECAARTAVSTTRTVLSSAVVMRTARPERSLTP